MGIFLKPSCVLRSAEKGERECSSARFLTHEIYEGTPLRLALWSAEEVDPDDTQGREDLIRLNMKGKSKP